MNSTPDPTPTEPSTDPNSAAVRADEQLTRAYQQLQNADEQLARVNEQFLKLEQDAEHHQPRGRPALRGLIGLLLAACIGAGAVLAHSTYGETARLMVASWMQQRPAASPQPQAPTQPTESKREPERQLASEPVREAASEPISKPASESTNGPAGEPVRESPVQVVAAGAPAPSAPAAPAVAQPVAPTTVALPPEVADMLQTMARDVANLRQGIEQLKTNLAQVGRDNARAVNELKASQEQVARLIAAASEQKTRQSATAPAAVVPARTASAPAHRQVMPDPQFRSRLPPPPPLPPPPVLLEPDE